MPATGKSHLQAFLEVLRQLIEVSLVSLREHKALHAGSPRRDGLFLDPTDGKDLFLFQNQRRNRQKKKEKRARTTASQHVVYITAVLDRLPFGRNVISLKSPEIQLELTA